MGGIKNHVLSLAGFDPSGGAGILADIKTFDRNNMSGMAVTTATTFQNDTEFEDVSWLTKEEILRQYNVLSRKFSFSAIKIGLIESLELLDSIISRIEKTNPKCYIVWDPILSASAGFKFHDKVDYTCLKDLLKRISIITPNTNEVKILASLNEETSAAKSLSEYCNVLLKGGHSENEIGTDYLFTKEGQKSFKALGFDVSPKHGSGCVLSAAITAQLAQGENLSNACKKAKAYTEKILASNSSLLGTHYEQ